MIIFHRFFFKILLINYCIFKKDKKKYQKGLKKTIVIAMKNQILMLNKTFSKK